MQTNPRHGAKETNMYTVEKVGSWWKVFNGGEAVCACGEGQKYESDARRIARALNIEAAMGEVQEAASNLLSNTEYEDGQSTGSTLDCEALEQALAALDAAGKDTQ